MTNDITTISGAAQEVIDHLEQHLYDKGVLDARFNPATGILGLVDRIPDIEPSVNINLTIDLSLSSSHSSIHYGESVVLTATLLASYEGVSEVDLQTGEITGATIIFKNGSTIIGTGTTDSNGVATLTYTPTVSETTLSINAVFDGTDNFNRASSSNVSIEVNDYLDLTSDKSILSYADNDNCIFTATYYGVTATGRSINLYNAKDDSLIGVMNDNNDGTYSYTYQSRGVGDLEVYAKDLGSFVSKRYDIVDAWKYIANPTRQTNLDWSIPPKARISYTMKHIGSGGVSLLLQDDSHNYYVGNWSSTYANGVLIRNIGSSSNLVSQTVADIPSNTEIEIICEYDNGQWKYTANGNTVTFSANYTPTKLVTIDITSGQSSYMKDLIIKPL